MNLESKDLGFISLRALGWQHSRVDLEQDVVEGATKVGAVDLSVAGGLWVIKVFAFDAVEFYGRVVGRVVLAHREKGL